MKNYSIGEVSDRLGISRDALRFYEKKGIIKPAKEKNGYRTYTYNDIHKLSNILFYRRLNFSLEDIERILYHSSLPDYRSMLLEKIKEEKDEILKHQQSLIHLNHLRQLSKNVELCLNQYDIRPLRRHYIISDKNFIQEKEISDLCYICQEFKIQQDPPEKINEFPVIAGHTAAIMNFQDEVKDFPVLQHNQCIYTIISSKQPFPDPAAIQAAVEWTKSNDYDLAGNAYTGYLPGCTFQQETSNEPVFYIELFLPLHKTSSEE